MKKLVLFFLIVVASLAQFCSSTKKAQATVAKTTYTANVHPLIQSSCSPCHIAGQGRATALNNYEAAKREADEMITRIQRNPDDKGFMPMRHPRLADSTIATFVKWKADGLLEN